MEDQNNVYVLLMKEYLQEALRLLEAGNIPDAATYTRIAYDWEQKIPSEIKFKQ